MTTVTTRQVLNINVINQQLTGPGGSIMRDLMRRGRNVQRAARALVPKDQGRLKNSINLSTIPTTKTGIGIGVRVGTNVIYARYVHDGTGVYGPRGAIIVPRNTKTFKFQLRGLDAKGRRYKRTGIPFLYPQSTKGQEGVAYLRLALPAAHA